MGRVPRPHRKCGEMRIPRKSAPNGPNVTILPHRGVVLDSSHPPECMFRAKRIPGEEEQLQVTAQDADGENPRSPT